MLDERRPTTSSGVRFQHSSLLPIDAAEFLDTPTATDLARRDDVDFYRVLATPGVRYRPGVDTREVDLLQGIARDHEHMLELIAELRSRTVLRFRDRAGEPLALTGAEIVARNLAAGPVVERELEPADRGE